MRSCVIAVLAGVLAPGILVAQSKPAGATMLAQFDPKEAPRPTR